MKWLLVLLSGGLLALLVWEMAKRRRRDDRVSARWLREADRRTSRIEFVSVCWRWPINKIVNEHSRFQSARLRRTA